MDTTRLAPTVKEEAPASLPFGTLYFGVLAAAIGLFVTAVTPGLLGPVIAIGGVILAATGLVLRALWRLGG